MLDSNEHARWVQDNGDYTHNITYNLTENSVVMDLGGYTGIWAQQIIEKYNPYMYILEPVTEFYEGMVHKFCNNNKVHLMNVGVAIENKDGFIFMGGDATSTSLVSGESTNVKFNTIDTVLEKWSLAEVDLIQINIEGDEYTLLENMIKTGSVNKFRNIQVQFHLGIENNVQRRDSIRAALFANGYRNRFNYQFVWESWYKLN